MRCFLVALTCATLGSACVPGTVGEDGFVAPGTPDGGLVGGGGSGGSGGGGAGGGGGGGGAGGGGGGGAGGGGGGGGTPVGYPAVGVPGGSNLTCGRSSFGPSATFHQDISQAELDPES